MTAESKTEQELENEKIALIMLAQGRKVAQFLETDTWEIIENRLKMSKQKAEQDRKKEMRIQCTREKMLYHCGVVDGLSQALEDVYDIVTQAKIVEANIKRNQELEQI